MKKENSSDYFVEGDTMKRPDLARTYELLAKSEDPYALFYRGELTDTFVEELAGSGITKEDFGNYEAKRADAIVFDLDQNNRLLVPTLPSSGVILGFIMKVVVEVRKNYFWIRPIT